MDAGGGAVVDGNACNRENTVVWLPWRHAHDPQHLRATAFEEAEIACVVDHAGEVRVLIVNAHRQQVLAVHDSADGGQVAHVSRIDQLCDGLHP